MCLLQQEIQDVVIAQCVRHVYSPVGHLKCLKSSFHYELCVKMLVWISNSLITLPLGTVFACLSHSFDSFVWFFVFP